MFETSKGKDPKEIVEKCEADDEPGRGHITRAELIERIAKRYDWMSSDEAGAMVNSMLEAMCRAIVSGRRIEIRGFGSFGLSHRPARVGRNPKTGASVSVAEKLAPVFRMSKKFREVMMNKS